MKIGLIGVNVGGDDTGENMVRLAQKAEQVGLESPWTFEHVIVPMDYQSRYPYHHSGRFDAPPETSFIDPLIALSHVAAVSKTLRLGTGINIVSQTNPLLLAKQVASLDHLSGGRLMLGVGVGWLAEEFAAMGTPFEGRGARMDDALTAMKKVWTGEVVEHQSEIINWSGFKGYPLPVQKPHLPIIVGGTTPPPSAAWWPTGRLDHRGHAGRARRRPWAIAGTGRGGGPRHVHHRDHQRLGVLPGRRGFPCPV